MNIVIFSGGTGSVALQNGLKEFNSHCKITNIINALDSGKGTGICRKICDVLGPSDIRKNHITQYKNSNQVKNKNIIEFYENRYDFNSIDFCFEMLDKWGLEQFKSILVEFFTFAFKKEIFEFRDFNLANIVYAMLFKRCGYEKTIDYFKELLDIDDDIILNSFSNSILKAHTESGKIINSEHEIVDYNNIDKITDIFFEGEEVILNKSINLDNCDLLILSAGTQWASLIPTYATPGMKELIENVKCKKILVCNNKQDKDMIGVNQSRIIDQIEKFISLKDFIVLVNEDADKRMNYVNNVTLSRKYSKMGNDEKGRHDPILLAKECLKIYFNLIDQPDCLMFDFDRTIFDRDNIKVFKENCEMLDKISSKIKCVIVSGNGYRHVHKNLSEFFGGEMDVNFDIWADGGVVKYDKTIPCLVNKELSIENENMVLSYLEKCGVGDKIDIRGANGIITCISVNGLDDSARNILCNSLNDFLFADFNLKNKAYFRGRTSIDILNMKSDKKLVYNYYNKDYNQIMYIGDELDNGNDKEIANLCFQKHNTKDIFETNTFLKLILGEL